MEEPGRETTIESREPEAEKDGIDTGESARAAEPGPRSETQVEAVEAFIESRNVGTIIRKIAGSSVSNPREMKRMVNLARFYLTLRSARCAKDADWRPPSPDQYARWIVLTLRWPDMMRWLQWGADETHWPNEPRNMSLVVRRLRVLEEHAAAMATSEAWQTSLTEKLGLQAQEDGTWSRDVKLFEFFQNEAEFQSEDRLSRAAARGFW